MKILIAIAIMIGGTWIASSTYGSDAMGSVFVTRAEVTGICIMFMGASILLIEALSDKE